MAEDIVSELREEAKRSHLSFDAIVSLSERIEQAVVQTDMDIDELIARRRQIVDLLDMMMRLGNTLYNELPIDEGRFNRVVESRFGGGTQSLRNDILEMAHHVTQDGASVTVDDVMAFFDHNNIVPPWGNSRAVIATILSKSGVYRRVAPGQFERISKEENKPE